MYEEPGYWGAGNSVQLAGRFFIGAVILSSTFNVNSSFSISKVSLFKVHARTASLQFATYGQAASKKEPAFLNDKFDYLYPTLMDKREE